MNSALQQTVTENTRFRWGLVLAVASWIPVWFGFFNSFRGISENKATGMGAIAGAILGGLAPFAAVTSAVFAVTGVVLLLRTLSREHRVRSLFSVLVIGLTVLTVLLLGFASWFIFHRPGYLAALQ